MNEPGRLAGEPGIELQNPDPDLWPGLGGGGGSRSLLKLAGGRGVATGVTAPGRGLDVGVVGRGPTVARRMGYTLLAGAGVCGWSSELGLGRLPCGLPPGGREEGGTARGEEPGPQANKTHTSDTFLIFALQGNVFIDSAVSQVT